MNPPGQPRRVGLFGGTFDPPHYGHLMAAQEAAWQLELDRVLFLPARQNPLKQGEVRSPAEQRVRMVELAVQDNPCFEVSRADLDRPPPSYTVDLLKAVRAECVEDAELFFLLGADLVPELPWWYRPEEILRLSRLVVVTRPGAPAVDLQALEERFPEARGRVIALHTLGVAVSSTELRARVREGRSLRYLVPPLVGRFVEEQGLYRRL